MANLARLLAAGAIAGSALVVVQLDGAADGTSIVVFNGDRQIGAGTTTSGLAQVTLDRPLAQDDLLTASVGSQGNLSGPTVRVLGTGVILGPWVSPSEITVIDAAGVPSAYPAAVFKQLYGYIPSALENRNGTPTINYPEFARAPANPISFDLGIERQGGQTSVTVSSVLNQRGGVLVQWADLLSGWSNTLSRQFSVAGTYTVSVKGTQNADADAVSRQVTITIQSPAPASPAPDSRIEYYAWRNHTNNTVQLLVNSAVECQAKCDQSGASADWQEMIAYDNPYERQALFLSVPSGAVTITIRTRGETDASKYRVMPFTKYN